MLIPSLRKNSIFGRRLSQMSFGTAFFMEGNRTSFRRLCENIVSSCGSVRQKHGVSLLSVRGFSVQASTFAVYAGNVKMLAKSRRNGAFADKSFLRKLQDGGRETLSGLLGGGTVLASSVHRACSVCLPCLLRPRRLLVPSGRNACEKCADCLRGMPRSLVTPLRKGSRLLSSGFRKPKRAHYPLPKAVFYSLSNVRISLSACHAADCGFPLPFFRSIPQEGRKNGFSRDRKVKVSKCKGRDMVPAR